MASAIHPASKLYEYLHSDYSPDREYVDGEILERNVGEYDHATLQLALIRWFDQHREAWGIRVRPELRVQMAKTRYRVPDICVLDRTLPKEQIITRPPLVCVEILSPEDRLPRGRFWGRGVPRTAECKRVARRSRAGSRASQSFEQKFLDYRNMGVRGIWVIDPATESGYEFGNAGLTPATCFTLEASPIFLDLPTLFSDLD